MAEAASHSPSRQEREASAQGWRLLAPPLLFIAQFGAVYGWVGLACAFGWSRHGFGVIGLVPAGVLLLTAAAVVALWLLRPVPVPSAPPERERAYDPAERGHFMVTVTRRVGWLALAGMLAVAAMALLARTCAVSA